LDDFDKRTRKDHTISLIKSVLSGEQASLALAFLIICIVLSFLSPVFLSTNNIMNVLRQTSLIAITGIGMVMIILVGEIDLSVGSSQAVVGVFTVWMLNMTGSLFVAVSAGIGMGAVLGMINGLLVTRGKINSLIATLGTMAIFRGIAFVTTNAVSIQANVASFMEIGTGYLGIFPVPVVIMLLLFAFFYYILHHTAFGRYVYAIGGNSHAARLSGLAVDRTKMIVYILGGVLTSFSAIILASRMYSGQPNAGTGFELQVVAAVILGGISLTGGVGSLLGAFIGILILSVLSNGLILLNVSSFYHEIVRGAVIILAVYLDGTRRRNLQKKMIRETR
jgi:ribose transport system permease protein